MRFFLLPPIAAALLSAPGIALAKKPPATQVSADQAARLPAIAHRGRLLFDLDRAAWVATDDFAAKVGDLSKSDGRGYVTEREGEGFVVTFYAGEPGSEVAIYVGHVAGGRVTSGSLLTGKDRVPLTPAQKRLAAARRAGYAAALQRCTAPPFNITAVPVESAEQPLELYLTSAQAERDVYPFGGHYLLTVGPDGQVMSTRKFTNSCINMPLPRTGPAGAVPAAAVVSHLLDPTPTEIHVFMSISIGKPVYVVTSDPERIWVVNGESIAPAGPKDKMAKAIRSQR